MPVTGLFTTGIALSVRPDFPAKSLTELVAMARAQPGKLSYATWGVGTSAHLQMELLRGRAGMDVLHVPYKAGPEATQSVIGGQTDIGFDTVFGVAPRVKAGQMRALTVFAPKRAAVLPEVPTNGEQGFRASSNWVSVACWRRRARRARSWSVGAGIGAGRARCRVREATGCLRRRSFVAGPAEFGAFREKPARSARSPAGSSFSLD